MKQEERKGYLTVFLAGVLWGTIGLFVKLLQGVGISTQLTSFLRLSSAFLILLVVSVIRFGPKALIIDRKTLGICIVMGIVVQGICNLAYSYAVTTLGVSVAVVFMDTAPIYTLFLAALLFQEKITKRKFIAVCINIVGCVMAATNGNFSGSTFTMMGILAGLTAGFTYALSSIFGRFATARTNPFIMSVYCYLSATVFLMVLTKPWYEFGTITPRALLYGFMFGLIPTALSYVLYYTGVSIIKETSRIPVIASVELPVATIIGVTIFGDAIGVVSVVGIIMVLGSIMLMNTNPKNQESVA